MSQFMILLYDDPSQWQKVSPEEMQNAIAKYRAWREKPFTIDGKRLGEDAGKVMRLASGKPRATDGPYSETKEVLGGFYLIEAADYDEAVKLAMDHPHLQFGTLEIRKLWEPPAQS
jgi:hypothetical protein